MNPIQIAGGSLSGLMTGIELLRAGADPHIYEQSTHFLDDRGAGIVVQPETSDFLINRCGVKPKEVGVWILNRQYLNRAGARESCQNMPQLMTSWGLIYRALRRTFPPDRYHEGTPLEDFEPNDHGVVTRFKGSEETFAPLLIGADGSRSLVRRKLMPEIKPRYAGYVAWRGVVPEGSADAALLETFADNFTFQQMRHSHILCYLIPGPNGEIEPGQRRLNWVWYWNVPERELSQLMTGSDGRERGFSVPPGQVRKDAIRDQDAIAEEVFCPQFLDLWHATEEPFIQPILDLSVPRMVHGRVVVLGDAAFIPRPHTAASTSKAASNAIDLAEALRHNPEDLDAALIEWEPEQLKLGRRLEFQGSKLGNISQFS